MTVAGESVSKYMIDVAAAASGAILLVDDSEIVLEFVGGQLRDLGFHVVTTVSAKNAFDLATAPSAAFDLAILDVIMPEMNGYELARELRRHPRTRHIGILFLSTLADADNPATCDPSEGPEHLLRAVEAGGDDFIGKSTSDEFLKERVITLIDVGRKRAQER